MKNLINKNHRITIMKGFILFIFFFSSLYGHCQSAIQITQKPIKIDTKNILVSVDVNTCRWSAEIKGTEMQMNDIYFLPGDDPSGWTVTSEVNNNDSDMLGSFKSVTLHGSKPNQLDFDYKISVSKNTNDILVCLNRTNNTVKDFDLQNMDYFVSSDTRLGSTSDRWISLGTQSQNRELYKILPVINLITPTMYIVNHVIEDSDSGNGLLMGHVTSLKGASRFELASGWQGKTPDRMRVRAYCSYKITIPPGKGFEGEKLLICFNTDALKAMEHQGDLIAIAHDVRLKERRPIDPDDRVLVSNNYSRFHGWMSGAPNRGTTAEEFFTENGLFDFYWGLGGPARGGSWGIYGSGGRTDGRYPTFDINGNWGKYGKGDIPPPQRNRTSYPDECYLPIRTVKFGGEKVIDFSNPLTVKLERERAFETLAGKKELTGRAEMDFSDWWDKWPGQYDPFISALEAYRLGGEPWREAMDSLAPRMVIRSNMAPVDHFYGLVDIMRASEDADQGYEDKESAMSETPFTGLFGETVRGSAIRFFYNTRVFWNDGDGFHIYKFDTPHAKVGSYDYGQAKVVANFRSMVSSTLLISESFDETYPENRIELLKRISPPTMDAGYPVDLFIREPARIWNMPVERPFGSWCILGVFNYTNKTSQEAYNFTTKLSAQRNLRLDQDKEYIVYEFWSKQLIGTFKGTFETRPLNPYDCDIYSIVEMKDHPVLISTSRHIRQMAFDIKDLAYDKNQQVLNGVSRAVAGDPYQLRIYVPEGFSVKKIELNDGLTGTFNTEGNLLTVDFNSTTGSDVEWKIYF
ncbi:MAG: hypothetical protein HQ541_19550 [Mariniphaga sp.]|nr:hypothetical protein [Mariniphaga sp.]